MKILGQVITGMYLWSLTLLILIAAISSYQLGQFPIALIFAVIICTAIDLAINVFHHKKKLHIPVSSIITGLIIGCIAPIDAPLIAVFAACLVAVLSKFFIKFKAGNIFNPASLGILIGLGVFSIGSSWWGSSTISILGYAISISIVFILSSHLAKRLAISFAFVISAIILGLLTGPAISVVGLEVSILEVNCLFAFLMLAEPKTTPSGTRAQVVYGIGVALIYFVISIYGVSISFLAQNSIFIALLIGNFVYAFYKMNGRKIL